MKIAVLSRNSNLYSTKRLVEAAEQRGHEAHVIDHLKCNIELDQNGPTLYYNNDYLTGFDAVIPRIGASVTFYGTAVVRQFEMMKVFTVVSSKGLVHSRDKLRCLQVLSREGIRIPKTVFTNYSKHVDHVVKSAGGAPVVLKLLEGTQGLGVVLAENENAAQSVLEAFNGLKARVIVQEFIKEAKGADIRAFVVGGKVVGAMKRQGKDGEFRSNLHRGGSSRIIELTDLEKDVAIKAAATVGLGVAGVDMLQSERGPLVIEVNSSPGLEGIEKTTHFDIAGSIIEYIEANVNKI
ncbi:MAG: 30S ribosomal protein S6--L-glutamate ligase [Flavobacteriia bacterium]|nr:30S ribosomal protein S6--L-glutamate ligase [Flavobacteriia bacterium]OJX37707.1 MAG: alpha-L-glutamate ligase [Flavobacteriia bacterium 40-80]